MSKILNVMVTEEDSGYVALNPDTGVASQGDTLEAALANLHEAVSLYFEEIEQDDTFIVPHHSFLTTITV